MKTPYRIAARTHFFFRCAAIFALLAVFFPTIAAAAIPMAERNALIAFYQATAGDTWTVNNNWCAATCPQTGAPVFNASGTECSWQGVICDGSMSHVIGIILIANNLDGELPDIGALSALETLDLHGNGTDTTVLYGTSPNFLANTALVYVDLSDDDFDGAIQNMPAGLQILKAANAAFATVTALPASLTTLDLSNNLLAGSLPTLPAALITINVSGNTLGGAIPPLPMGIVTADFSFNSFVGSVPDIQNRASLDSFDATANKLTGSLPEFTGATALENFSVYDNAITGHIPTSLSDATFLLDFEASKNQLDGPLPSMDTMPSLQTFNVSDNKLSGVIPDLVNASVMNFFVAGNMLSGPLPTIPNNRSFSIDVSGNPIGGTLPSLAGMTQLIGFGGDRAGFTGPLPSIVGDTALTEFLVHGNKLTGAVPTLNGIPMIDFDVGDNLLTGSIPSFSASANALRTFDVSKNSLTGGLPSLTNAQFLYNFRVGGNRLTGAVPAAPPAISFFANSSLCPNLLTTIPTANDATWDLATGFTPWWATPYSNNLCDDVFTSVFD
jgi:Leucine-rich repeat (LRR) protein